MNAPTEGTTSQAREPMADRRQSIGKYVKRLRTVLRRDRSSKESPPTVQEGESPSEQPKTDKPTETATTAAPVAAAASSASEATVAAPPTESKPVTSTTGLSSYSRSATQQERARALFAKYGLSLEAHEWITTGKPDAKIERVEKPIRMRVHRQCHRCQTTFGSDRVCSQCEHKRCKKCPRYPTKKDKGKGKEKEKAGDVGGVEMEEVVPADRIGFKDANEQTCLTIKPRSGVGPDLERRTPKQRVRRSCHHCGSLFVPATATTCTGCQHTRCTKCPREPSKRKKWPDGYPGDVQASDTEDEVSAPAGVAAGGGVGGFGDGDAMAETAKPERVWRKPRQRVRWNCERCDALFMDNTKICPECGHERCTDCKRAPHKKIRLEPDPDVVKAVEERLARFKVEMEGADGATPIGPAVPAVAV